MEFRFSRRKIMQGVGGAALAQSLGTVEATAAPAPRKWPIEEGPDTPKLCLSLGDAGGPLPASVRPAAPPPLRQAPRGAEAVVVSAAAVDTADSCRPKPEPAPAPPAEAPARRPGFVNTPARYQRIRQLGVTHLLGVTHRRRSLDRRERSPRRPNRQGQRRGGLQRHAHPPRKHHLWQGNRAKDLEPTSPPSRPPARAGCRWSSTTSTRTAPSRAIMKPSAAPGPATPVSTTSWSCSSTRMAGGPAHLPRRKRTDHAGNAGGVPQRQEGEVQGPAAAGQ